MDGAPVTEQELAVHVFALPDRPPAEEAVRAMWSRCRELLGTTTPITGTGLQDLFPDTVPSAPASGSLLIAAQKDRHGHVEAVLRQEQEVLNLSVLVSARTGLPWTELDRRLDAVLGDPHPLMGVSRLYLGKAAGGDSHGVPATAELGRAVHEALPSTGHADQWWRRGVTTVDGLALWEITPTDDMRAERRFVVLARADRDDALNAWAWSAGGSAAMPSLARYLMHMAKVRYQVKVWSYRPPRELLRRAHTALAGSPAVPGPPSSALTSVRADLARTAAELHTMRQTVESTGKNAAAALGGVVSGQGRTRHDGAGPFDNDRALIGWFVQQLAQDASYAETFEDGARRMSEVGPVLADAHSGAPRRPPVRRAVRILSLADEWLPGRGGLSAFNRYLCIALAEAGAEVYCAAPAFIATELDDASAEGIQLVEAPLLPGGTPEQALMRRPRLPDGVVPDVVIGHSRITGPQAMALTEEHYRQAVRVHFVHMAPKDNEWWKPARKDDPAAISEERSRVERQLARGAGCVVAVGPRLHLWLQRHLAVDNSIREPVRLDPGFDVPGRGAAPRDAPVRGVPGGVPQILLLGRLADASVKGLDIAAKAVGHALGLRSAGSDEVELLLRGAPPGTAKALRKKFVKWSQQPSLGVDVWNYTDDARAIRDDIARSSLVLMPSRAEGFGLVGLEAIVAGCPVLVSDRSGLGMLLREVLPDELAARVVVPVKMADSEDVPRWGHMIATVLSNRKAAFATADEVRRLMAERCTWAMAAGQLLDAVAAVADSRNDARGS